jgi:hypothetical protein
MFFGYVVSYFRTQLWPHIYTIFTPMELGVAVAPGIAIHRQAVQKKINLQTSQGFQPWLIAERRIEVNEKQGFRAGLCHATVVVNREKL